MTISLILPVLNEENAIPIVAKHLENVSLSKFSLDKIIVNNNSTDNSPTVAKEHGFTVIDEKKRGYGAAIISGVSQSNGEVIIIADCDATYPIDDINRLISHFLDKDLDILFTNRFKSGYTDLNSMPFLNRLGNLALSLQMQFLFGISLRDSQSGMIILKRELWNSLPELSSDFSLSQEIKIYSILQNSVKWDEIDIDYYPRIGGKKLNNVRDGIKNFFSLLKIKLKHAPKR